MNQEASPHHKHICKEPDFGLPHFRNWLLVPPATQSMAICDNTQTDVDNDLHQVKHHGVITSYKGMSFILSEPAQVPVTFKESFMVKTVMIIETNQ